MRRSTLIRATALAGLLPALELGKLARAQQPFPSKVIKLIIPYMPGASTDQVARPFAQELSKELKTPVIVESRPGGGTSIGALALKSQPADGHTLLVQTGEMFATKLANPKLDYEFSDFEAIAPLSRTPLALVVPGQYQIKTLDDLKAHAAKKNNELDFGSLGLGANMYTMLSRTLSQYLGIKPNMILYKGGAQVIPALMTGEIDAYFPTVGLIYGQKDNPRLHVLALTSDGSKNAFFPNAKSFKELGIKDMVMYSYFGIAIRSDTPNDIKMKLKQAAIRISNSDEMKEARRQIALEDFPGTLDEFNAEMRSNIQKLEAAYMQEQKH